MSPAARWPGRTPAPSRPRWRPAHSELTGSALIRVLAGCVLCAGLALAVMVDPSSARASGEVDFSLVPLGAQRYFIFDARPGRTVVGRLRVISRSDRTQAVVL